MAAPAGYGLVRYFLRRGTSAEAARVHSAERVIARGPAYEKLQSRVGPSGQRESQQGLYDAYDAQAQAADAEAIDSATRQAARGGATDQQFLRRTLRPTGTEPSPLDDVMTPNGQRNVPQAVQRRRAAQRAADKLLNNSDTALNRFDTQANAPAPTPRITRNDMAGLRAQLNGGALDPLDVNPVISTTERGVASRINRRNQALQRLQSTADSFDLNSPAPQARGGAMDGVVDAQVQAGVQGQGNTLQGFAASIGVSPADVTRALDQLPERLNPLAAQVARLRMNHNVSRTAWGPLKAEVSRILTEDGTVARAQASAATQELTAQARKATAASTARSRVTTPDLAQQMEGLGAQRVEQPAPEAAPEGRPEANTGRTWRPIDRKPQWENSKDRIIRAQDNVAREMYADSRLSDSTLAELHGSDAYAIQHARTGEEAMRFFDHDVVPDLRMNGVPAEEIERARTYFSRIAAHKRYQTQAEFEAGTQARNRGRPRNDQ
jgi:hypothetical protein